MTPQQYERLTELFHAALEIARDERAVFLNQVCDGDTDLRRELESLLAAHEQRAAYTEKPPDDIAAGMYLAQQGGRSASVPSLARNTRLDHFEIRSLLGKGGMGEVYLAEDMRLHRKVALKILPAAVASNQDRMRRFEQEATAAAALNHPHIAHIYEIGESESTHFIAIEHIDGDTLRDKIHRDKAPLHKLLKYLTQVAEGLTKAHTAGIVHRDLKPDNIMITHDDYAKILDFGLAKLIEPHEPADLVRAVASSEVGPEIISQHSLAGMVMGTAGYMSPEQAQGKVEQIDQRSDIFSFGCILFEAVTGQRPFEDESIIKLLQKVAYEPAPPIKDFNPSAPPELQRIVGLCLAKDRKERYQTIKDVALELNEVRMAMVGSAEIDTTVSSSRGAETSGLQTSGQSGRSTSSAEYIVSSIKQHKKRAIIAAVLGAIAIASVVWFLPRSAGNRPNSVQAVTLKRLTPDIHALNPTLSPNGEYLVYSKKDKGLWSVWLKDMTGGNAVQTMPPIAEGYGSFQFSPDGKQIYYNTKRRGSPNLTIARIPLFGGMPQDIATNVWGTFAVAPDGKQLAFVREQSLVIADTEGKSERDLIKLPSIEGFVTYGSQLSWSPDGRRIAICAGRNEQGRDHAELLEISVSDGARRVLPTPDWSAIDDAAWLADGASLLVTAREKEGESFQIWRVAYPSGEATRVTNDSNNYESFSLTADSHTLVAEQMFSRQNLWLASLSDMRNAKQLTTGSVAADGFSGIAFAPDDTIIFTSPRSGNVDLWRMNPDGSNQQQLTANAGNINRRPNVTPDGRYIVFVSSRTGTAHIWRMDTDGQNAMRLTDSTNPEDYPHLSSDGQWIYYSTSIEERPMIMKVSIHGGSPVRVSDNVASTFSTISDSLPSPDGKLLACGVYVDESAKPWKVAIISSEGGELLELLDVPLFNGVKRWTSDSKSILYINGATAELWQQPIDGRPPTKLFTLSDERLYNFAISSDFKKIAYSLGNHFSEAVLISNFRNE